MDKPKIKPLPFYHCHVVIDESALSLLGRMGADGQLIVDRFTVRENQALMVLNHNEINMLRGMGLKIEVGQVLFL
jgi:hypothetical protein